MWELNVQTRKITPTDCNLGQLKRIVNCIEVSEDDQYMYCGTTSGDVIQVRMHVWEACSKNTAWYLANNNLEIILMDQFDNFDNLSAHKKFVCTQNYIV